LHTVGEDEELSIKYVADTIVKAIGFQGDYTVRRHMSLRCLSFIWHQFDTSRADGQFRKPASNKKLLTLIGGFQFTPFEQGKRLCHFQVPEPHYSSALDITVDWFLKNYDAARTGNVKST